jgi:NMD protein affecting ribosome stability and mRNA decay
MLVGSCQKCGAPATLRCALCGRTFCRNCLDSDERLCSDCLRTQKRHAGIGLPSPPSGRPGVR